MRISSVLTAAPILLCLGVPSPAQKLEFPFRNVAVELDSGFVANRDLVSRVVFSKVVRVPGASWLKLHFADTQLEGGTVLRLTSLADGAWQFFETWSLREYRSRSADFNGEAVLVELFADPFTTRSRVKVISVDAGEAPGAGVQSQCGPADDRVPSTDKRQARQHPTGCTTWLISKFAGCTAGHCTSNPNQSMHFNVPPSSSSGSIRLPHPDDQYPYDSTSLRRLSGGVGRDWAVFATVRNSNHGMYPGERQGSWYELGTPPSSGQIRITGYGTDRDQRARSQTQQTHVGPLSYLSGTRLCYVTDTEGGNSGSPVIRESTGKAVGIHTHGGCRTSGSGCNSGTAISRSDLQAAIKAVLASRVAGSIDSFGAGCKGTNGVPTLELGGARPEIGGAIRIKHSNLPVNSVGVLWFGLSDKKLGTVNLPIALTGLGATGCSWYVSIELALPRATGAGGGFTFTQSLPSDKQLIGATLFEQFLASDPKANSAGITTSNAVRILIGGVR